MDDYAESLHISTNWFIRNFKQYMKISPAQYILSLRMVNAQSLLENTEYNIGEIAEIIGYDNPLYFSRVFKKEYGVSPAQYRKNLEESTEKWERFHSILCQIAIIDSSVINAECFQKFLVTFQKLLRRKLIVWSFFHVCAPFALNHGFRKIDSHFIL